MISMGANPYSSVLQVMSVDDFSYGKRDQALFLLYILVNAVARFASASMTASLSTLCLLSVSIHSQTSTNMSRVATIVRGIRETTMKVATCSTSL